ncbi:MAG: hypothetical protein CME19_20445 [Gemmatimonadetes bacterium]|nr:hypothetical protein [Gemmatimonadota bacterium]
MGLRPVRIVVRSCRIQAYQAMHAFRCVKVGIVSQRVTDVARICGAQVKAIARPSTLIRA